MTEQDKQLLQTIRGYMADKHRELGASAPEVTEDMSALDELLTRFSASDARGTMECPICGVAGQHWHPDREVEAWLEAQASRFYRHIRMFARVDKPQDFIARVIDYLQKDMPYYERAMGHSSQDIIDAIVALQEYAAWQARSTLAPTDARMLAEEIDARLHDSASPQRTAIIAGIIARTPSPGFVAGVEAAIQAVERVGNFGDLKREELTQEFGQPRFDMMHQILATLRSLSASKDPQP